MFSIGYFDKDDFWKMMGVFNMFTLIWIGSVVGTAILCGQKNLNMTLWLVLSLFFGPLIFIIVLVLPAAKSAVDSKGTRIKDLQSLKDELVRLRKENDELKSRLDKLNKLINGES